MPITAALAMMGDGSAGILMPAAGAGEARRGVGHVLSFLFTQKMVCRILNCPMFYLWRLPRKEEQKLFGRNKDMVLSIVDPPGPGIY